MYFDSCKDKNELKAMYRKLAMKNHPDRGGDEEVMMAINAEYDKALKRILASEGEPVQNEGINVDDLDDGFREVIDKLLNIDGIEIELCGAWLWISGTTREHRVELKAAGCRWSNNKKLWYWHHEEPGKHWRRGNSTMSDIRRKYGSQVYTASGESTKYEKIGETA